MVPVMKLGRANEPPQQSDRQSDVGMNVDGPNPAKSKQPSQCLKGKAKHKRRQIYEAHRVNGVHRMFAMGCEPVEMFCAVMNRVEAPQPADAMLQPVSPINAQIA